MTLELGGGPFNSLTLLSITITITILPFCPVASGLDFGSSLHAEGGDCHASSYRQSRDQAFIPHVKRTVDGESIVASMGRVTSYHMAPGTMIRPPLNDLQGPFRREALSTQSRTIAMVDQGLEATWKDSG